MSACNTFLEGEFGYATLHLTQIQFEGWVLRNSQVGLREAFGTSKWKIQRTRETREDRL